MLKGFTASHFVFLFFSLSFLHFLLNTTYSFPLFLPVYREKTLKIPSKLCHFVIKYCVLLSKQIWLLGEALENLGFFEVWKYQNSSLVTINYNKNVTKQQYKHKFILIPDGLERKILYCSLVSFCKTTQQSVAVKLKDKAKYAPH